MNQSWSRSIADILGAPLQQIDAARARSWLSEGIRESEQIDFKAELYGNTDSARRELAGDLAAFANHRGGVLILGIAEDEHGAASDLPLVELGDAEERRMLQIVAGNTFPHLPIQILRVPVEDESSGLFLIAVGPSPLRPHAISVNDALRYPRRDGTVTRYLSESEVADLYRNRFAQQHTEIERASLNRQEAVNQIDRDNSLWVAVSAVPTGAGSLTIDASTPSETQRWAERFIGQDFVRGFLGQAAPLVRTGLRRLRLMTQYAHNTAPNYQYAELHVDGAATALHIVWTGDDQRRAFTETRVIPNVTLLWATAKCLTTVVEHAVATGAWGDLTVEVTLFGPPRALGFIQHGGIHPVEGGLALRDDLVVRHTLALDEIAAGPQAILAAVRLLLSDVFQAFGSPEVLMIAPSGALRMGYLGQDAEIRAWAAEHGVEVE